MNFSCLKIEGQTGKVSNIEEENTAVWYINSRILWCCNWVSLGMEYIAEKTEIIQNNPNNGYT
jgi:hypothetical protein